ncbi:MAG: AbrB/MazE/SpoVT family DNA-binding domain-containing protein [Lachnospiraceae bacterium]|jgi:AbrB family looped-hinge helix DNA binding protein|nr:AbrB/MazE/SpoVT family DNA-binding domain-containing protein [Lachnospiraceae bacterium]
MDVLTVSSKGQISIPSKVRRQMNIAEGDKLAFVVMDGTLMMRPMKMPDKAEFEKSLHDANKTFSK